MCNDRILIDAASAPENDSALQKTAARTRRVNGAAFHSGDE